MPRVPPDFAERSARSRRFSLGVPSDLRVTRHGDVLFRRTSSGDHTDAALWAVDARTGNERLLADPHALLGGADEVVDAAERARRERLRQRTGGISAYHLVADDTAVIVALSGRAFLLAIASGDITELDVAPGTSALRPSPDGTRLAGVRDRQLCVGRNGTWWPVTPAETSPHVTWGLAEYVAQEEMGRLDGFWWSPDGTRLAVTRVDTADVETVWLADLADPLNPPTPSPYPRPGKPNADVALYIVAADPHATTPETTPETTPVEVRWDRTRFEYLAEVVWPAHGPLTLLVQDRAQQHAQILLADPDTGDTRVLAELADPAWLNLPPGGLRWTPDGTALVLAHETPGAWVLDLVDVHGDRRRVTDTGLGLRRLLAVTDTTAVVLAGPDPTATQVARIDLATGTPTWLTTGTAVHAWAGASDIDVITTRRLDTAPTVHVRSGTGDWHPVTSHALEPDVTIATHLTTVGRLQWHCGYVLPDRETFAPPYPVLLDVYGGPGVQRVSVARDDWLLAHYFADHGYAVVTVDGRGTPGRGRDWERAIHGDFVTIPLADQLDALHALAADLGPGTLDLGRVAIRGWSFGGYLSAAAVLRRPDAVHAAIVGAPVTDWADYDTHYTERYLGVPTVAEGPDADTAYARSGLLGDAAHGCIRPMLLIHGTADDNVTFRHSVRLADALFRAGTPATFVPLPQMTHMADDITVSVRLLSTALEFCADALGTGPESET